ncbi:MAG: response regulator, partial [Ardenticatenales bacterium]|nr:response regulator [Ardenticatenales bacterium]
DMRMPIMDGWGFARHLKEQKLNIPILVMTAAHNANAWADEIGAQGCIDKPFDVLQLLEAVEKMFD